MLRLEADSVHQLQHPFLLLLLGKSHILQGLCNNLPHREPRIQRGEGILEYQLHLRPHMPQRLAVQGGNVRAVKGDCAGGGRNQVQNHPPQGGFAAAGLTHQRQRLTLVNFQGDIIHCLYRAVGTFEILFQVLRFQKNLAHLESSSRKQRTRWPFPKSRSWGAWVRHCWVA